MAIYNNTDSVVTVNSVDISEWVLSVEWSETAGTVETVAMGDTSISRFPTHTDGQISLELHADFGASAVYATLYSLLNTSTTVTFQPNSGATSATNPEHSVSAIITEVPLVDSSVGEVATISVSWPFTGDVTVTTA